MTDRINKTMGMEFLDRSLRTTCLLLLIFLPFGVYYFGIYSSLAVFSGAVWGVINLIFISALVRALLTPGYSNKGRVVGLSLIKFPALYAGGYALLAVEQFSAILLLTGFSFSLLVIVLKSLGRIILHLDDRPDENDIVGKATHAV